MWNNQEFDFQHEHAHDSPLGVPDEEFVGE